MSNNPTSLSPSSSAVLKFLKSKKPLDGWSVERKSSSSSLVRLTRRNVPLTESYFIDLHRDIDTGNVVGILTRPGRNGTCQGQILVDSSGKPAGNNIQLMTVSSWVPSASTAQRTQTTSSSSASATSARREATPTLSDESNRDILRYAAGFFGVLLALRVVAQATALIALGLPLFYLYLVQTCPPIASFDAKKELKRVLRGHHLPEDHPNKPKGTIDTKREGFQEEKSKSHCSNSQRCFVMYPF